MILSKNTSAVIVLPQNAYSAELFAAEELQKYVHMLCGASLTISETPAEDPACNIFLGTPDRCYAVRKYCSAEQFAAVCPGPEGIFLKSCQDGALMIAGSDDSKSRGIVYAVYELLERYCGCALAAFTDPAVPGGEFVPAADCLNLTDVDYVKPACDLIQRGAVVQYEDPRGNPNRKLNIPFLDWLCKNRYNMIYTWSSIYEIMKTNGFLEEAMRRGIEFGVGLHEASTLFLPPRGNKYFAEHYYETHPEFYRLKEDGTRFEAVDEWGQWIFCSRNNEMISELAKNMKHWLRENPQIGEILFNPNDGLAPQCCCPKCSSYSKTENYIHVVNAAAKLVREEFPRITIQASAYVDVFECPDDAVVDDSIIIEEAVWHETGLRTCGKADGTSLIGTFFEDNLRKWHDHGAQVRYYDYYMGVYQGRQRYLPMADEVPALTKRMKELGFSGWCTQIELFNMWNNLFNFYVFARTAYDTQLSMEDSLCRFTPIFGEGAAEVAEVIRYAEEVLDGQCEIMTAGQWLMAHIDKEKVYALYESALAKATTPAARNNIRLMRMAFRYSDLETSLPETKTTSSTYESVHAYTDPSGELDAMTAFDSFHYNDPGYGIAIPAKNLAKAAFTPDKWYIFD